MILILYSLSEVVQVLYSSNILRAFLTIRKRLHVHQDDDCELTYHVLILIVNCPGTTLCSKLLNTFINIYSCETFVLPMLEEEFRGFWWKSRRMLAHSTLQNLINCRILRGFLLWTLNVCSSRGFQWDWGRVINLAVSKHQLRFPQSHCELHWLCVADHLLKSKIASNRQWTGRLLTISA